MNPHASQLRCSRQFGICRPSLSVLTEYMKLQFSVVGPPQTMQ